MNALRTIQKHNDDVAIDPADGQQLVRLQASHRTAWEFFLIAWAMSESVGRRGQPFTPDKVAVMLRGADLNDGSRTAPRDIQFELFLAAFFSLGGAEVRTGEPDLLLRVGYEHLGIAAKRVSSVDPQQLKRHIRKAVEQIRRSKHRGFIAINLDSRLLHTRMSQERGRLLDELEKAFFEVDRFREDLTADPQVCGLLLLGHASEWVFDRASGAIPRLQTGLPFRWEMWSNEPAELMLFRDFYQRWRASLQNHLAYLFSPSCGRL